MRLSLVGVVEPVQLNNGLVHGLQMIERVENHALRHIFPRPQSLRLDLIARDDLGRVDTLLEPVEHGHVKNVALGAARGLRDGVRDKLDAKKPPCSHLEKAKIRRRGIWLRNVKRNT